MRAVVMTDEYHAELREVPVPEPGPGEILVKVAYTGICGSDLAKFRGDLAGVPGRIIGHEFSGTVAALGEGVRQFRPGDRVVIDPTMNCGWCDFCRRGRPHLCDNYRAVGRHIDGGLAEYCSVPALQALLIPEELTLKEAALAEPVACVLHGMELLRFRSGSGAVVVGAGAIGLIFVQVLKLMGARAVVAVEPNEDRRRLAVSLGAAAVDPNAPGWREAVRNNLGAEGADFVVEAVGHPRTVEMAVDLCRKGAAMLLFGVGRGDHLANLPIFRIYHEEISITGSFLNPFKQREALDMLAMDGLSVTPLVTVYPFAAFAEAVADAMAGKCIKVLLEP